MTDDFDTFDHETAGVLRGNSDSTSSYQQKDSVHPFPVGQVSPTKEICKVIESNNIRSRGHQRETITHTTDEELDLVRFYLGKIGSIPVLTREKEQAIALQIDEGRNTCFEAALSTLPGILEITLILESVRKGHTKIKDVLNGWYGIDDDESTEKERERLSRALTQINRLLRASKGKGRNHNKSNYENRRKIARKILDLGLKTPILRQAFNRVNGQLENMTRAHKELAAIEKLVGMTGKELLRQFRQNRAKDNKFINLSRKLGLTAEGIRNIECTTKVAIRTISQIERDLKLSTEELLRIACIIQDGMKKEQKAKTEMSRSNLRLVVSVAKRYLNRGLSFLDLVQEGNIGLLKAVEKFNHKLGHKFSTYATWWIRQAITRSVSDQARTIRVPVHMLETIQCINKASRKLRHELCRDPSKQELCDELNLAMDIVELAMQAAKEPISVETPIGDEDTPILDLIENKTTPAPIDLLLENDLAEKLEEALASLSPRECKILKLRYGINEKVDYTLEEVGKCFNVTRERIRQIENKALIKLRTPKHMELLRNLLPE